MSLSRKESTQEAKLPFIVRYFDPSIRAEDTTGRTLDNVLNYSDNEISHKHDFIQYLFPLPEESMVNPWAPLITEQTYTAFRSRPELRAELLKGFSRMLSFYGFTFSPAEPEDGDRTIIPADDFSEQSRHSWRRSMDHNHLRLTRIIRCLRVLSCEKEAQALYAALLEHDSGAVVSRSSKMYWARAARRPLWLPPDEPDDDAEGIEWLREVAEGQAESGDSKDADEVATAEASNAEEAVKSEEDAANAETADKDGERKAS